MIRNLLSKIKGIFTKKSDKSVDAKPFIEQGIKNSRLRHTGGSRYVTNRRKKRKIRMKMQRESRRRNRK